jgi:micrococcal nuclease
MRGLTALKSLQYRKSRYGAALLAIFLAVAVALAFIIGCSLTTEHKENVAAPTSERALVREVIDGDTVRLEDGRRVRYLGIDTPETGEYYYEEATERNRELVGGKVVELRPGSRDVDEYERLLRYVYIDDIFVNAELVAQGYAKAYRKGPLEEHSEYLFQLEEEARANSIGLWAEP